MRPRRTSTIFIYDEVEETSLVVDGQEMTAETSGSHIGLTRVPAASIYNFWTVTAQITG